MTLIPSEWSVRQSAKYFGVSNYLVRKAKLLAKEKGIFALPDPKVGNTLSEETLTAVDAIYHDDEFSRTMPGKKDCVSVGKNT